MESPQRSPTTGGLGGFLAKRQDTQQSPVAASSPRGKVAKDAKPKRVTPPKLGLMGKDAPSITGGSKWTGKSRFNSSATSRPLVPVTERISHEEKNAARRAKRKGSEEKVDITPDGGSAGRDGRQFTVANVGNNGRIYLR